VALVRYLFQASLLLWGGAIVTALAGHLLGWEAMTALSFGFRKFAPAVTLIWLLVAIGRMIWVRYWPFRGSPKQPR
jgi:hypothetical protein